MWNKSEKHIFNFFTKPRIVALWSNSIVLLSSQFNENLSKKIFWYFYLFDKSEDDVLWNHVVDRRVHDLHVIFHHLANHARLKRLKKNRKFTFGELLSEGKQMVPFIILVKFIFFRVGLGFFNLYSVIFFHKFSNF